MSEGKRKIKTVWSCLRHHEHRWCWIAWLCVKLRGFPKNESWEARRETLVRLFGWNE